MLWARLLEQDCPALIAMLLEERYRAILVLLHLGQYFEALEYYLIRTGRRPNLYKTLRSLTGEKEHENKALRFSITRFSCV